jgi:predicted MPP superfamily phosphohydrolase
MIVLLAMCLGQSAGAWWILRGMAKNVSGSVRSLIRWGTGLSILCAMFAFLLRFNRVADHLPDWLTSWARGVVILWALLSLVWLVALVILRRLHKVRAPHNAARRQLLGSASALLLGAPVAALGYGVFIQRNQINLREQDIQIPDLPHDLDGLRLVQLTDIHLSPFLSRAELERAVAMANETKAHVALVTGDLITRASDPLDDCLDALAGLRAEAGVFGCMGNHEIYARSQEYTDREGAKRGLRFLRKSATALRFGDAIMNFAGVDYQELGKPYLVGAEAWTVPGAVNVMLSHNPDVFPVAAQKGYSLTISGHTHGGQVRVEILGADLNIARFYTPYVDGLYREESSAIFVSRGIGTIGVPARLGAPPEVALIRLCRT